MRDEQCAWVSKLPVGRFEGRFFLEPSGPDRFRYLPAHRTPFRFIRSNGEIIEPQEHETDGGSLNVFLQLLSGITRWKYYWAFPVHDWEFEAHHQGLSGKSFEDVNLTLAEAMKTMMSDGKVQWDKWDIINVHKAVNSVAGLKMWNAHLQRSARIDDTLRGVVGP